MKQAMAVVVVALGLPVWAHSQEETPPTDPAAVASPMGRVDDGPGRAPGPLGPDQLPDPIVDPDRARLENELARTEVTLDLRTRFGAGVGLLGPLGAAARVSLLHGLGADVRDEGTRVKAVCALPIRRCANGFLIQADAGTGGGKLSLGVGAYAKVHEESFKGTAGVALRAAVARTWGDPVGTEPGLTYVGPELDLSIVRVTLTLGVIFRVSGDRGAGTLFSWGLGFGS
jgi:hypothetical protein